MFRRFRAAGELPYGAFGELVWETQRLEMQALAERVMAERQQAQSMEIDLQCGGVNLTGWLQQVQPDGLLRWRPSLLSVSQRKYCQIMFSVLLIINTPDEMDSSYN